MTPLEALRYHVTGAIERGQASPIVEVRPAFKVTETTPAIRHAVAALLCLSRVDLEASLAAGELKRVHDRRLAIIRRAWLGAVDRAERCQRKLDRARIDATRNRWRYAVAVWQGASDALAPLLEA